jgi:hypothetical protein
MLMLAIRCPKTHEDVPTGIPVPTLGALTTASFASMTVQCPHCGETHMWDRKDAFPVMVPWRLGVGL